jgi:hypothetical protein
MLPAAWLRHADDRPHYRGNKVGPDGPEEPVDPAGCGLPATATNGGIATRIYGRQRQARCRCLSRHRRALSRGTRGSARGGQTPWAVAGGAW